MRPKISIVTISFNQGEFIEAAIRSVVDQAYENIEYIMVDAGSTDGSVDIIRSFSSVFADIIIEPDGGPADGLNKGLKRCSGQIFVYLNADDTFEKNAFANAVDIFEAHPEYDVICGHAWIVDAKDVILRKVWSDPFVPAAVAYGAAVHIQPSTFIKMEAMKRTTGFNTHNNSNWDGELLIDLFKAGANIKNVEKVLSCYRLHESSITNSGSLHERIQKWNERRFSLLMGRDFKPSDRVLMVLWKIWRQLQRPEAFLERLFKGPVYRRGV